MDSWEFGDGQALSSWERFLERYKANWRFGIAEDAQGPWREFIKTANMQRLERAIAKLAETEKHSPGLGLVQRAYRAQIDERQTTYDPLCAYCDGSGARYALMTYNPPSDRRGWWRCRRNEQSAWLAEPRQSPAPVSRSYVDAVPCSCQGGVESVLARSRKHPQDWDDQITAWAKEREETARKAAQMAQA